MLSAIAMGGTMLNDLQTQNDELRTRMSQLESDILTKADISALEVVSSTISAVRSVTTRTCSQVCGMENISNFTLNIVFRQFKFKIS